MNGPSTVRLLRTVDAGDSWTIVDTLRSNVQVTGLTISPTAPSVLFATTPPGPSSGSSILKSTDGGDSWTALNAGLPAGIGASSVVIDPTDSSTIYLPIV